MPTVLTKRNLTALGALGTVVALYFAVSDPLAVQETQEDAAAERRRELVANAGGTCTLGYDGGDLSTVQPFPKPAKVSLTPSNGNTDKGVSELYIALGYCKRASVECHLRLPALKTIITS